MTITTDQRPIDWVERARSQRFDVRNFVDGRCKDARGAAFRKYAPRDGSLLYEFATAEPADIDEAVASARVAFADGRWSRLGAERRKDALHRLAALIERHREEFALLECLDVGKTIGDALTIDVPMAAAIVRFNAEALDKVYGHVWGAEASSLAYQLQRPAGVVAGLIGWNFPLVLAATKLAPALAAGNSLVLKPSELTSLSAARLAQLALEAGIPAGVLNVVHGDGRAGAALARHTDVNLLSFTGSTRTGKRLLVAAGESNMKRTILECGGKAPNIVFDDCPDVEAVADAVVARAFWNQGQVCTASSRLLVQDTLKPRLLDAIIRRVSTLRTADPLDPKTRFAALVSREHLQKVSSYIEEGERSAATTAFRGDSTPPFEGGFYAAPVIFDDVSSRQSIAQEEIFGPVLSVLTFRNEAQAIQIANDTIYGLSAILWTRDLGRAHRLSSAIEAGSVTINATDQPGGGVATGAVPIAAHKQSGLGCEGGLDGLRDYMTTTTVQWFV